MPVQSMCTQLALQFIIIGLIHVFEVVNIRRGPKNGLTPELVGWLYWGLTPL